MIKFSKISFSGFTPVLVATAISGLSGYVAVWLAAQNLIPTSYTDFSVLWSTIFFSVGALSGIQQELTRSTSSTHLVPTYSGLNVRFFPTATFFAAFIFVISGIISISGGYSVVSVEEINVGLTISIGLASFVFLSVLLGVLYGLQQWRSIAVLVAGEGITRLLLIVLCLSVPGLKSMLPWAICLPFAIITLLSAPLWMPKIKTGISLDVKYFRFATNTFSTVAAAAATAVVISGFPLLLRLSSSAHELELLAPVILIVMLVRAPLVVLAQSMQNLLIVKFSGKFPAAVRLFTLLAVLVLGFALLASLIGFSCGAQLISLFFGGSYEPSGLLVALVLLTSGLLAIQIMSGALVLARNKHLGYILGWFVSALATVLVLFMPFEFELRVTLALFVGPIAGMVSNALAISIGEFKESPTIDAD